MKRRTQARFFMLFVGLTTVKALAASPQGAEVPTQESSVWERSAQETDMSLFDFLGVMMEDGDGWVDPLDLDAPMAGDLDAGSAQTSAPAAEEIPVVEEQP